jgi:hypothetical protein
LNIEHGVEPFSSEIDSDVNAAENVAGLTLTIKMGGIGVLRKGLMSKMELPYALVKQVVIINFTVCMEEATTQKISLINSWQL